MPLKSCYFHILYRAFILFSIIVYVVYLFYLFIYLFLREKPSDVSFVIAKNKDFVILCFPAFIE